MKTNIVGFLFIIVAPIFIFSFIVMVLFPLLFSGGQVDSFNQIWQGFFALLLGIYSFILGSAVRKHKKWSWYAGIVTITLATIGNLLSFIFSFSLFLIVPLLFDIFSIYAFLSEKSLFFILSSTPVPPISNPPMENMQNQPTTPVSTVVTTNQ